MRGTTAGRATDNTVDVSTHEVALTPTAKEVSATRRYALMTQRRLPKRSPDSMLDRIQDSTPQFRRSSGHDGLRLLPDGPFSPAIRLHRNR